MCPSKYQRFRGRIVVKQKTLFDEWPERYDEWFETPIGKVVKEVEAGLILGFLNPEPEDRVLDAGCGTGVFTLDILTAGARVTGIDISRPMLNYAGRKTANHPFFGVQGDILHLPFHDSCFDKAVSITALEFIADAGSAVDELFRVTRPGGCVVVATLNSLSQWAVRRNVRPKEGEECLWESAFFRSPNELLALSPWKGMAKTVIHFKEDDDPEQAIKIERLGQFRRLDTGAFVAIRWEKP